MRLPVSPLRLFFQILDNGTLNAYLGQSIPIPANPLPSLFALGLLQELVDVIAQSLWQLVPLQKAYRHLIYILGALRELLVSIAFLFEFLPATSVVWVAH